MRTSPCTGRRSSEKAAANHSTRPCEIAVQDRLLAEQDLRRAIAEDELLVYYQPLIDLSDGRPVGAEALVRWRHASGEVVAPGQVTPLAEETGLIRPIGDFVTQTACEQLARWNLNAPPSQQEPSLHV